MAKKVELYTQPGCTPCQHAAQFFEEKGIPFTSFDVTEDNEALDRLLNEYESRSTPTIVINGHVISGFDQEQITKLLELQ